MGIEAVVLGGGVVRNEPVGWVGQGGVKVCCGNEGGVGQGVQGTVSRCITNGGSQWGRAGGKCVPGMCGVLCGVVCVCVVCMWVPE